MTAKKSTKKKAGKSPGASASAANQKAATQSAAVKRSAKQAGKKVSKKVSQKSAANKSSSVSQETAISKATQRPLNTNQPLTANSSGKFALAAAVVALILSVYTVYQTTLSTQITRVQVAGVEDRLDATATDQQGVRSGFSQLQTRSEEDLNNFDKRLVGVESTVAKLELASQASIDDIKANLGESVARWKLDEVHSLLTRVNRMYQITGDQAQAIAGLELAQASLATINNPGLAEVNTALAEDLLRVQAGRNVDIVSINDRLLSILSLIPDLVLAEDAPAVGDNPDSDDESSVDPAEDGILAAGKSLFSDIGSLVKHKNLDAPLQPSLDELARYVVYESLRLQVHAVMAASLRRDNASYQSQLMLASGTLARYFDAGQTSTQTVLDQLQVLESFDVDLDIQAISDALTALNRLLLMEN